jgi:O-acetylhomoserine/O-acetylserine sulfhydrylase-like pyridoxal-dependent enzyme
MPGFCSGDGDQAASAFRERLATIALAASTGIFTTFIARPAGMTQARMSPEVRDRKGIGPELIRPSLRLVWIRNAITDPGPGFASSEQEFGPRVATRRP